MRCCPCACRCGGPRPLHFLHIVFFLLCVLLTGQHPSDLPPERGGGWLAQGFASPFGGGADPWAGHPSSCLGGRCQDPPPFHYAPTVFVSLSLHLLRGHLILQSQIFRFSCARRCAVEGHFYNETDHDSEGTRCSRAHIKYQVSF